MMRTKCCCQPSQASSSNTSPILLASNRVVHLPIEFGHSSERQELTGICMLLANKGWTDQHTTAICMQGPGLGQL